MNSFNSLNSEGGGGGYIMCAEREGGLFGSCHMQKSK